MNWMLVVLVLLPALGALLCAALGSKRLRLSYGLMAAISLIELALCAYVFVQAQNPVFSVPRFIGLNLRLTGDGFRALYAGVASFMWLMTSLLLPQYLSHGHAQSRYNLFTMLTMSATVGVFLSDDLVTCFLFFEMLSFTSYCWVIHEETPQAFRAGTTYLTIAVLGGMVMLMGLMMLQARLGTLSFDQLGQLAHGADPNTLYLPGALILTGFGAKAGMFPLHVWLPKAHPVAPAPASALLSGVLTKVGVFGILVVSTRLFFGNQLWGNLMLGVGLINMALGATLALFSTDLKRTLACSSMSQIGFILVGIGMQGLLGEHNALAAQGTVLHMLNHSLIKLVLFMAAGVVYMNLHQLNLNDIRGYGRGRWGLMACFAVGAASLSGIPLFSGYASKTLLHESIVEYIVLLGEHGLKSGWYLATEWVFIISGGLTFCYMTKLFVALFIEKHPTRQAEFDARGRSMKPLSALALGGSALVLFLWGLWPEGIMAPLANRMLPFLHAHEPAHAVHFLAPINLIGGAKSLLIGAVLYPTLVRGWLMKKDALGHRVYVNRWPTWLDMEDALYRPLVKLLGKLGMGIAKVLDWPLDQTLFPWLAKGGMALTRFLAGILDGLLHLAMRTVLRPIKHRKDGQPEQQELTH